MPTIAPMDVLPSYVPNKESSPLTSLSPADMLAGYKQPADFFVLPASVELDRASWKGELSPEMAGRLFAEDSPAWARYQKISGGESTVRIDSVFPESSLEGCPSHHGRSLVMIPACTMAEFAAEVGIRQAQHLGEAIRGKGGRRSCCGWQGALLAGPSAPRPPRATKRLKPRKAASAPAPVEGYFVTPVRTDAAWVAGFVSAELARGGLFGEGSPAALRFECLNEVESDQGVPLTQVFPHARVELKSEHGGTVIFPGCSTGQFAQDVGIRQAQHLSEMVRGMGGRRSCHGWRGGVTQEPNQTGAGSLLSLAAAGERTMEGASDAALMLVMLHDHDDDSP